MSQANTPEALVAYNQAALAELRRTLTLRPHRFSLVLAQCQYRRLQTILVQHLQATTAAVEIPLAPGTQNLRAAIADRAVANQALLVTGLIDIRAPDGLLKSANLGRDAFPQTFPQPVVFWVNDATMAALSRYAPDFKSFAGPPIVFRYPIPALIEALHHQANALFGTMLALGDDSLAAAGVDRYQRGSPLRTELTVALAELAQAQQPITPELQASLDFLQGRDALSRGDLDLARYHFDHSLAYWAEEGPNQAGPSCQDLAFSAFLSPRHGLYRPSPSHSDRRAVLHFYLGVTWRSWAALQANRHPDALYRYQLQQAEGHFLACLQGFRHSGQGELVGRFLHPLAEVRQKLGDWSGLEVLAQEGVTLHRGDAVRLARDHGYLAEVALAQENWDQAEASVTTALTILKIAEAVDRPASPPSGPDFPSPASVVSSPSAYSGLTVAGQYQRGWYFYLMARGKLAQGQSAAAIFWLEKARQQAQPQRDLALHRQILAALHQQYYHQGDYRQAFAIKQQQRQLDTQFKLRAFWGAGPIRAHPAQVTAPGLAKDIAPAIEASGRRAQVEALVERLGQPRYRLVILHGPSGVGKSSMIYGGLLPALAKAFPEGRATLALVVNNYRPWTQALSQALEQALNQWAISHGACPTNAPALLDRLKTLPQQRHLQLVLIFDQLEEFFSEVSPLHRRRGFYQFLVDCLNTPYLKVVLALREDALHYLLELERGFDLDMLNHDILSRDYRHYLGNLQPHEAKTLIRQLSQGAFFYLEEALIDQLVQDLTVDDEISPIELQVVGAQLQQEGIDCLAVYRQIGPQPKETLVQRFLAAVVEDCGTENALLAQALLYLLTDIDRDQRPYRPQKSQADLETDLSLRGMVYSLGQITLVLEVLVGSGVVFCISASPDPRYQLAHDYLVGYVRQEALPATLGWRPWRPWSGA